MLTVRSLAMRTAAHGKRDWPVMADTSQSFDRLATFSKGFQGWELKWSALRAG